MSSYIMRQALRSRFRGAAARHPRWHRIDAGRPEGLNGLTSAEPDGFITAINHVPMKMEPTLHVSARATCDGAAVHIADLAGTDGYRSGEPSVGFTSRIKGCEPRSACRWSVLATPSARSACTGGRCGDTRRRRSDLIQSFAAQAVIAIENARQFAQTQQALVRETASADILRSSAGSSADIQPVFDLIAKKAAELSPPASARWTASTARSFTSAPSGFPADGPPPSWRPPDGSEGGLTLVQGHRRHAPPCTATMALKESEPSLLIHRVGRHEGGEALCRKAVLGARSEASRRRSGPARRS